MFTLIINFTHYFINIAHYFINIFDCLKIITHCFINMIKFLNSIYTFDRHWVGSFRNMFMVVTSRTTM